MQDTGRSFEAIIVPKYLALTILVIFYYLQQHLGTKKTYSFIKRDFFLDRNVQRH